MIHGPIGFSLLLHLCIVATGAVVGWHAVRLPHRRTWSRRRRAARALGGWLRLGGLLLAADAARLGWLWSHAAEPFGKAAGAAAFPLLLAPAAAVLVWAWPRVRLLAALPYDEPLRAVRGDYAAFASQPRLAAPLCAAAAMALLQGAAPILAPRFASGGALVYAAAACGLAAAGLALGARRRPASVAARASERAGSRAAGSAGGRQRLRQLRWRLGRASRPL
ncbi:hypothetical protein B5M42_015530 [Paenibacillus athensensis]|uniref:Uncharacterized protein n=1 Tax=Paenibacillus athensensis TaxID=1967502 RepID=A0A4Y8Q8A4_9BACL|nr:hypothetical protein [Paenibacillus athensensis]MCD1260222.1 hypothetical protein [Paenibacillus athensensis]